jgi:hypothetical protein
LIRLAFEDLQWEDVPLAIAMGIVAPITTPYTLYLGVYDAYHGTDRLDSEMTAVYGGSWGLGAGLSWAYHAIMFPGQYRWLSGGQAWRLAIYLGGVPLIAVVAATAAGIGYVATSDVHGAAAPNSINFGVPVGSQFHTEGSSTDIYPGLEDHPFWPWNW